MAIQIRRGNDSEWESNKSNIVAGEPAVTLDSERMFVGTGSGTYMELANLDVLADAFDSSASYEVGDFVAYHGKVYKFTSTHSGAWNASDVEEVALADALDSLGEDVYTKAEADALLALKADKSDTYTKAQVDASLALKADKSDTYTKAQVDASLALKADKSDTFTKAEVNSALALKADKSDTYTKEQTDIALAKKANVDGYYEDMTVGNAEQLVTNLTDTESEPFTFRTSGGNLEIGDREELKVIGGSVVWNQIISVSISGQTSKGITVVRNSDGSITVSGTATEDGNIALTSIFPLITNHVYYISGYKKIGTNGGNISFGGAWADTGSGKLAKNVQGFASTSLWFSFKTGDSFDNVKMYPKAFDLTKIFGTEIAGYIHSLEVATTGAGIAWFKSLFPNDYYPYNAGEMLHVQTSEFKTVGFNQWDEEWEQGYYYSNSSGKIAKGASTTTIRSKNPIPVFPNTAYHITGTVYRYFFCDGNDVVISYGNNANFTTPVNATRLYFYCENISTYNHDICINLHWDGTREGEYEPYTKHSYSLDDSLTLRGIPKLDADNNLYYDGDTYEHDGTVTRNAPLLDLGSINWTKNWGTGEPTGVFYSPTLDDLDVDGYALTVPYTFVKGVNPNALDDKCFTVFGANRIYIKDTAYTDATALKTSLSNVYVVYESTSPTTESADPFTNPQIVDNWGTEEFVVPTQSGVEIPVGHETVYPISLRDKLESAPNLPDDDGDYLLHMESGEATYKQLVSEFPSAPTTDGTYVLKATVSNGTATLTWVAE